MSFDIQIGSEECKAKVRDKGKSVIIIPSDFTVIDLETTGLDPEYDDIIEVAALKVRNNEIVDEFCSFVRPPYKIGNFITKLTGITNDMLAPAQTIRSVLPNYVDFIGDDIVMGHKVSFDINFIHDFYIRTHKRKFKNDYVDTMRIAKKLYPELEHHRLKDLIKAFNIKSNGMHRALDDCYNAFYCYQHMRETIAECYKSIDGFINEFKRKRSELDARTLSTEKTHFDESHPLYNKTCVFTGVLEKMLRKEAMQRVLDVGGHVANGITAKTDYLILGNNDYCSSIKDGKSTKQKRAEAWRLKGRDIETISENVFYEMLDYNEE